MMRRNSILLFACLSCVLAPCLSFGQLVTATLEGTAQDKSGAAIANAKVSVVNVSTGVATNAETNANGRFVFASLQPGGPYTVTAEAPSFETTVRSGIYLAVNQTADITITLDVGRATQKVEVIADASQLQTSNASIGEVISNRSVENLPLNQRIVYSLIYLVPGVTGTVNYAYNTFNVSVNGSRPGTNEVMVDGIPSTPGTANPIMGIAAVPSVDAVQEFKVMGTAYSTEFGRSANGIINVILKSGTNQLHGSVYEFLRNSALDANTFFNNRTNTALPSFKRSQFGASLTGPVVIPWLYKGKDKTFFLFSYEGLRQGTESGTTTQVPTTLQRNGDFSQTFNSSGALVNIYDPATTTFNSSTGTYTRQTFTQEYNEGPGNTANCNGHINCIPANRINSVAGNILKYYPQPNQTGTITGANNFFASTVSTLNLDTFDTKVDEVFNEQNRMFVRYSRQHVTSPPNLYFAPSIQVAQSGNSQPAVLSSAAVDYTHTFSPNFVMEIPFGYARIALNYLSNGTGFDPTTLGFPSYIAANADHLQFPGITATNYVTLGNASQGESRHSGYSDFSVGVNNTLVWRNHVFTFGFQGLALQANDSESGDSDGTFGFTNAITQGPNPSAATSTAGNAFASLLLGLDNSGTMIVQSKNVATTSDYYGLYLQDDWKVTSRLSLNAGVRYDLDIPRVDRHNRLETFDPTAASPLAAQTGLSGLTGGVVFAGANGASRRQFNAQYLNFSPRFGLAYQVDPNTAVRAAYGVYFGPAATAAGATVGTEGFSASTATAGVNGVLPSTLFSDPFPSGINKPVGSSLGLLTGIGTSFENPLQNDNRVGYTQNFELSIQRQLPFSTLIDAAYVGSHGVHLNKSGENDWNTDQLSPTAMALGNQLVNQVANPFYGVITSGPEAAAKIAQSYLVAPYPQFTAVDLSYLSGGYELYDSFQLKVTKRMSHGLTLLAAFTDQKQIDDYSGISNVGHFSVGIQNIYNQAGERSLSYNNINRNLTVSGTYDLPFGNQQAFGAHWNRMLNGILGGWEVNGIMTEQTGYPLAITCATNSSDSGSNVLRPNLTGTSPFESGPVKSRLNEYFNTAAFSQPAPYTFGDAPRTLSNLRQQGNHDIDFSAFKTFHPTERLSLQFHAEAYNLLNQVVFGAPNVSYGSSSFGVISSQSNTPRQIQAALKILF